MEENEDLEIFSRFLDLVKLHRSKKAKLRNNKNYNRRNNSYNQNQKNNTDYEDIKEPELKNEDTDECTEKSVILEEKESEIEEEEISNCMESNDNDDMISVVNTEPPSEDDNRKSELINKDFSQLEKRELVKREYLKGQLEKIKLKKQQLEQRTLEKMRKRIGKKIKIRRWAANPINMDRWKNGYHTQVFKAIKSGSEEAFFRHTRMPKGVYDILFNHVRKNLHKPKQRIGIDERLSLTLLYLAHGESLVHIAEKYKMGRATVRQTILDTCGTFWDVLSPIYLPEQTSHEYQEIARDFEYTWNMPNCVGAIGSKYIPIKAIRKGGPTSMILLAACDAKYMFTAINVDSYGSKNNEDNFKETSFKKRLNDGNLPLPADAPLPNTDMPFQYYFISDAALPLKNYIMRPYPDDHLDTKKQVFNYRLNRARRTIENTFGVLSARWRVLLSTLDYLPQNSETIILACVALHNFIMWHDLDHWYCPENYVDNDSPDNNCISGGWRTDVAQSGKALESIKTINTENSPDALQTQNYLSDYFSNAFLLQDVETFEASEIQFLYDLDNKI